MCEVKAVLAGAQRVQGVGRENSNANECQARNYDIHDAVPLFVGASLESVLFPEFFVRSGKVFRGNCRGETGALGEIGPNRGALAGCFESRVATLGRAQGPLADA